MSATAADLVRRARESAKLQQREVAITAQIHPTRLSRIENGRARPDREEVLTILQAIGTDESLLLADYLVRPLAYVTASNWEELPIEDKRSIREADDALGELEMFTSRRDFPQNLAQFTADLRDRLQTSARLLANVDYLLYFIGSIGVGKSTAINSLFNLSGEFRKARRKGKGFKTSFGLLPMGTGRTTTFEYRVAWGAEAAVRIDPEDEEKILRDARNICEYWYKRVHDHANPDRAISEETERFLRNMADLTEREDSDPLQVLIHAGVTLDDFVFEFRQRLDLPGRTVTELTFRTDRKGSETEGEWVQRRCRQLNFGLVKECPLPRRLTLVLPNPQLTGEGGLHVTAVDTRGVDESALRRDIVDPADDPKAISVLCCRFFDAPGPRIEEWLDHLHTSGSDALTGQRVAVLVLPYGKEPNDVTLPNGDKAGTKDQGYKQRKAQVERALGGDADSLDVLIYDSVSDDPSSVRDALLTQILEARATERQKVRSIHEAISSLLDDQEKAQFGQTQQKVAAIVTDVATRHASVETLPRPTYTRLVRHMLDVLHASSIWSITGHDGYGRSINIYEVFGLLAREDTKARTDSAVSRFRILLEHLVEDPEMDRPDMRRSKQYVTELMEGVTLKHHEFLRDAQSIAEATLEMFIRNDQALWSGCLDEWGGGPGYRQRIADLIERWFDQHRNMTEALEARIQEQWGRTFLAWLEGYASAEV